MPTSTQIQNLILTAELKAANLTDANIVKLQGGVLSVNWSVVRNGTRAIKSVSRQYDLGDYSSPQLLTAYSCLSDFVGTYGAGSIDPNAQIPGSTIITVPVLQGYNQDKLQFNNLSQWVIPNYNLLYASLYGNNPEVQAYVDGASTIDGDMGTAPQITYQTPNDPSTPITQILWDFGAPQTGYVQISGLGTGSSSGNPGSGGSNSYELTFHETDLLFDAVGGYYLPIVLPANRRPSFVLDNNVEISTTYDRNFTPARIYGFANNVDAQNIVITIS